MPAIPRSERGTAPEPIIGDPPAPRGADDDWRRRSRTSHPARRSAHRARALWAREQRLRPRAASGRPPPRANRTEGAGAERLHRPSATGIGGRGPHARRPRAAMFGMLALIATLPLGGGDRAGSAVFAGTRMVGCCCANAACLATAAAVVSGPVGGPWRALDVARHPRACSLVSWQSSGSSRSASHASGAGPGEARAVPPDGDPAGDRAVRSRGRAGSGPAVSAAHSSRPRPPSSRSPSTTGVHRALLGTERKAATYLLTFPIVFVPSPGRAITGRHRTLHQGDRGGRRRRVLRDRRDARTPTTSSTTSAPSSRS
jgi:hypothetical protein